MITNHEHIFSNEQKIWTDIEPTFMQMKGDLTLLDIGKSLLWCQLLKEVDLLKLMHSTYKNVKQWSHFWK